jgi:hypothetical protein
VGGLLSLVGRFYETAQPLFQPGNLASKQFPLVHPKKYNTTKVATHSSLLCLPFLGLRTLGVQLLSKLWHLKAVSIQKRIVVGSRRHGERANLSHLAPGALSERRHLAFAVAQEAHAAPQPAVRAIDTEPTMT